MQVIASPRAAGRDAPVLSVASGLIVGTFLLIVAVLVAYVSLATPLLVKLAGGPLTTSRVLFGVLAWTFALTAPVGFGLVGLLRIVSAVERIRNRARPTPTVRVARSLADDLYVAADVTLPDGRPVGELVIGPFGAAVINEMPHLKSIRRNRSAWEQRMSDGQWQPIDSPLDRAVRDAERVRRWFGADDRDFVVKVHAAVVNAGQSVERTSTCALITPAQIPAWLASLPVQRGMSPDRREGLAEKIRATF